MSLKYRTQGFTFKKEDRSEADQIFSVFTKDFGRIEVTGRAIRKATSKLRSEMDTFYFSEIEFIQGKNSKTLTDALLIKKFGNFKSDYKEFEIMFRVSDILDRFLKGQEKDEGVFGLLTNFFENANLENLKADNYQLVFQYFFWNFLSIQGYHVEVRNCAVCEGKINPYNIYFSNKEGGVICKNCLSKDVSAQKINSDIVKILRMVLNEDWDTLRRIKVRTDSKRLLEDVLKNSMLFFSPANI